MKTDKTYVIICRKGLRRDLCSRIKHEGTHCIECPYVGYVLREPEENNQDDEIIKEKTEDVES